MTTKNLPVRQKVSTSPLAGLSSKALLKFIIPSLLGVTAFLIPVEDNGQITIVMAMLSNWLKAELKDYMVLIVFGIVSISALITAYVTLLKPRWIKPTSFISALFSVSTPWLLLRLLGLVMTLMIYYQLGPEWVWSDKTGKVVLEDLATAIVTIFLFAALLLPLLTDYGLMEFVGTLFRNVFQKLFCIPGRASVDATASWLSSAAVGILITSQQYEKGHYSARDAAIIATNFSIVAVPFTLVIAEFVGLGHLFIEYYATVVVTGVAAAIIVPRLPPLSRIPQDYYPPEGKALVEEVPPGQSLFTWGLHLAVEQSRSAPSLLNLLKSAVQNTCDIWFGLMPPLVVIATTGLIVAEFTPLMTWLSYPLIPVLELLQLPEADKAAPAMLVGFAEMFLPAVVATGIESELTRFVIISVSVTQLVYMSEVGVMLLKSKIPLNFKDLIMIFLVRTIVILPIAAMVAHFIVFRE
ncbi:YjiH family protein [Oceanimonas sp. CHS3-5]|uniref:YjiH family protein n=1 Tax=Oceanimonas sp. CHS3-5 TaxID=3068186 RepID=UPI00273FBC0C|nr:YjiH family protein [Oceanimonas sp. CHS3-5]MDP5291947.1 YjiH family protein [Oceanimonas sp. CHS3-5]